MSGKIVLNVDYKDNIKFDILVAQKMAFLYNALEEGWEVKKNGDCYIFTRKHGGKKEVFLDTYLKNFITNNLNIEKLVLPNS